MKPFRNTASKTAIIDLINHSGVALNHREIMEALDGLCDRVTVYRVLDRLGEEGLVHKVVDLDGTMRFAACHDCDDRNHHHNHVHFSCVKCAAVTCLDDIKPKISLPEKFVVHEAIFTLSGLCPNCS